MRQKILRTGVACFIILLLLLTTTMGLVAVKQQQFCRLSDSNNSDTYFSIPYDITLANPKDDNSTVDFLRLLIKSTAFFVFCIPGYILLYKKVNFLTVPEYIRQFSEDKVVLIE